MKMKNIAVYFLLSFSFPSGASYVDDLNNQFGGVKIYSDKGDEVRGYLKLDSEASGSFFSFDKEKMKLAVGDKDFNYKDGHFNAFTEKVEDGFKSDVLPFFAKKYGMLYSKGTGDDTYVFLDYSCPFSRAFVERGELDYLAKSGRNVYIMPISRTGVAKGILDYGKLHCNSLSKADKTTVFLDWMKQGKADFDTKDGVPRGCEYWSDLKPYYGIVSHLGIEGVPAVVDSKS